MKHTFKKWLAVLLSLAMIFSAAGMVFADDEEEAAPLEIDLSRGTIDIGEGGTAVLRCSVQGGRGEYEYTWYSDDRYVVKVEGNGTSAELQAVGAGEASVFLQVYDGYEVASDSCVVYVSAAEPEPEPEPEPEDEPMDPLEVELSRGTIDMGEGESASLRAAPVLSTWTRSATSSATAPTSRRP